MGSGVTLSSKPSPIIDELEPVRSSIAEEILRNHVQLGHPCAVSGLLAIASDMACH